MNIAQAVRKKTGIGSLYSIFEQYGISLILILIVLILWEFVLPKSFEYVLPKPSAIVTTIFEEWYYLWMHTQQTILEAVIGFICGTILGIFIAVGFVYSSLFARTIYPYAVVLQSLPRIALLPLIVAIFGTDLTSKVVLITLACFFPTLVNMVQGLNSVDRPMIDLMRTLNATDQEIFWKVRLPFSLSYLFTASKITLTSAVLAALISEWMFAKVGLGAMIVRSMYAAKGNELWAEMAVATGLSIIAFSLAVGLEKLLIPWHTSIKSRREDN